MCDAAPQHRTRAMFHATAMVPDYDLAEERLGHLIGLRVLEYSAIDDPATTGRIEVAVVDRLLPGDPRS